MLRPSKLVAFVVVALLAVVVPSAALIANAQPASLWIAAPPGLDEQPGPIVGQAYTLLMDRFVTPPSPAEVLGGGWDAAVAFLKEKGVQVATEERPPFVNERDPDWRLFSSAYARLAEVARGAAVGPDFAANAKTLDDQIFADQSAAIQQDFRGVHGQQAERVWAAEHNRHLLDYAIVRGMAAAMKEGHTYFMPPDDFQRRQQQLRDNFRYGGIGVSLNEERRITEIFEGSPAESGGVRPGDQIVAVDGTTVDGLTPPDLSQRVRGEPGTAVELTINREGTPEAFVLRLTRAEIRVAWLTYRMLDDGIGYLRLRSFPAPEALGSFRDAIGHFQAQDVRGLVIDVRGNGGGAIDTGVAVASRFIERGALYQRVDRFGGVATVNALGGYWGRSTPIAVLANGGSGSMAEILAAALQENGVARVLGSKTSGNVAGTNLHPLADGSGLAVTVQVIKSGTGRTLNGVGLEPDQAVELDPALLRAGRDTQLDAAVEYLRGEADARGSAPTSWQAPRDPELPLAA